VVDLKDVVVSTRANEGGEGHIYMVFEYCDHDITGLLEAQVQMSDAQVKYYMYEILAGLERCHTHNVLHRDIKGANVLVNNEGDVKLADFGLARMAREGDYTNHVVTLWYRPPELLLGMTNYDNKIDMWSAGCVFAELLTRGRVLFKGQSSELNQLSKIYAICGTPNVEDWPDVGRSKIFTSFQMEPQSRRLREHFQGCSEGAVDLLDRMLSLNPAHRISASEAMQHYYFTEEMPPKMPRSEHPRYLGQCHEYKYSTRRKQHKKDKKAREHRERQRSKPMLESKAKRTKTHNSYRP